jgi:hypothetical protein
VIHGFTAEPADEAHFMGGKVAASREVYSLA